MARAIGGRQGRGDPRIPERGEHCCLVLPSGPREAAVQGDSAGQSVASRPWVGRAEAPGCLEAGPGCSDLGQFLADWLFLERLSLVRDTAQCFRVCHPSPAPPTWSVLLTAVTVVPRTGPGMKHRAK